MLLYELLTGTTPFPQQRLHNAGYGEIQRIILEEEPERPSTRLRRKSPAASPPPGAHCLATDLDWIVMKCLEKDRARRYETANGLAMDLQRHLNNEPVAARPPSRLYRFQKSISRNKITYAAATGILLALAIGLGLATWMFLGERRAHRRALDSERAQRRLAAEEAKEKVEALQDLYDSLLGQARATRLTRGLGYRDRAFALLERASALQVPRRNLTDLRNEAVACLGDFIGLTPATFTNFSSTLIPSGSVVGSACLAPSGKLAAFGLDDGTIELLEMPSGKEIARLIGTNEVFQYLCFNADGDQLHALSVPRGASLFLGEFWPKIQLASWGSSADGQWQQIREGPLPGAGKLLSDDKGVYAVVRQNSDDGQLVIENITAGSPGEKSHLQLGDALVEFAGVPVDSYSQLTNLTQHSGDRATPIVVKREGHLLTLTVTPVADPATGRNLIGVQWGWRRVHPPLTTLRLFNAETCEFVEGYSVTNGHSLGQSRFYYTFTPDRRLLAFETADLEDPSHAAVVNLYDWKTGDIINHHRLPMDASLMLSPDGQYLACQSETDCEIYQLPSFDRIDQFKQNIVGQFAVFSATIVALPMWQQHRIRLWNPATREDFAWLDEPEGAAPANFSADGNLLLTVGNHHARLQRFKAPEKLELRAYASSVPGVDFSPDGARLASVGKDRVIRVYDSITGRILWQTNNLPGPGQCVCYSPDGRWLVTGDWNTQLIWIWDARTGARLLELGTNRVGRTLSAQFSPDGRNLVALSGGGLGLTPETRIWAIDSAEPDKANESLAAKLIKTFPGTGRSLRFAPNNRGLVFAQGSSLYMWNGSPSTEPRSLTAQVIGSVECESFTMDGRQLLAMGTNGQILRLDVTTGKQVSSFRAADPVQSQGILSLSPDGAALAVISDSGVGVDIWNPKTGTLDYSLPAENGSVYWLAWSPDCRRLAVARDDGRIAIWNLDIIGQILAQLGLNR